MKAAISILDDVFSRAEKFAHLRNVTCSALFTAAVDENIHHDRGDDVTQKLDEVYAKEDTSLAPVFDHLQEQFETVFAWFGKLGAYKAFKGSSGQANMAYTTQGGKSITGEYVAEVAFETGPAEVKIVTVKRGDTGKIQWFKINSPALLQ